MGISDEAPSAWHWSGSVLAIATVWEMSQWMEDFCLWVSLCNSDMQNKLIKIFNPFTTPIRILVLDSWILSPLSYHHVLLSTEQWWWFKYLGLCHPQTTWFAFLLPVQTWPLQAFREYPCPLTFCLCVSWSLSRSSPLKEFKISRLNILVVCGGGGFNYIVIRTISI